MPGKELPVKVFSFLLVVSSMSQIMSCADIGIQAVSASADTFVIRYCTYHNGTLETSYSSEMYLDIYSNGTALYRYISYSPSHNSTKNMSFQLPMALVSELYDTLVDERLWMLNHSYEDSGWSWEEVSHTERLCIDVPDETKTVIFSGHSIMGIVPNSYALLNNIMNLVQGRFPDLPDAALDIVVSELPDRGPVANITAHLTNCGPTVLYDSSLCNISWPTFIVSVNGSTVGDLQGRIFPSCLMEFAPLTTRDFGPWSWNRSGLSPGKYVIMSRVVIWDCEIGDIASNLTWTPYNNQFEPEDDRESLSLALIGLGIAIAVVAAAFYVFYVGKRGPYRRK
ncbi:MAG TPA: hypothetical protein VMW71_06550 [Thermoplasmata archaeon]|nr:hypothetical protein [Thermoplasmata archaeon]